ncbi:GIY-YIG nuclease family protein [Clostridium nigeriense]|uniref:GIY-YIG nuclease family protein n=1 Tax=Clostridium nigeriense TaxID=1805470 RepID=UPI0008328BC2|nr:GIY-YIG nuclease family protein [Clostridium nigeriense]
MSEYMKNYYKNNKEKWKEYNSRDKYKEYHKAYFQENKEELTKKNKEYYEEFSKKYQGKFIYFILNEFNNMKYIGKTCNIYKRFALHKYELAKYNPKTDRVIYLDFSDKLSEEELADAEKYFIELYKLDLNDYCGDYDTNIAFKIDNDLVFNEFKTVKNNKIKAGELYDIEDRIIPTVLSKTEDKQLFKAKDVLFISTIKEVNRYINLNISDEEYEMMAKRVKDNYKDWDNAINFPLRKIIYNLKHSNNISLEEKGQAINYYYSLLKDYTDYELKEILDKKEMSLYKKIKGVDEDDKN